ncbi:hypothetical protein FSW04_16195 [Baekduia soli]|uniref:Uncharacterized protein n=1 Tax=Baekduia soli TaxID=496014 RepID=A0A5B8U7H5_9ACTN|nr:hypothetical protein [Baekduia soli]QEC48960.1 hypothetical protein FSW04_16195 [Baekduia soli]
MNFEIIESNPNWADELSRDSALEAKSRLLCLAAPGLRGEPLSDADTQPVLDSLLRINKWKVRLIDVELVDGVARLSFWLEVADFPELAVRGAVTFDQRGGAQ